MPDGLTRRPESQRLLSGLEIGLLFEFALMLCLKSFFIYTRSEIEFQQDLRGYYLGGQAFIVDQERRKHETSAALSLWWSDVA